MSVPRDRRARAEAEQDRRAARLAAIARVLWRILAINLAVALAKLGYGLHSGAIAITADGVHSLIDAAANVVGLIGVSVARRPPDANHPYGHRKYETFAALGIAAMLFYGCQEIVTASIERIRHPAVPEVGAAGVAVMLASLAASLVVARVERRAGERHQSEVLLADAAHTRSDALASLIVLASFAALRFGLGWADVAAAAVIVVMILRAGIQILRGTLSTLSDERRLPPEEVERVALEEPGVLEAHNVRSRGPADDVHLDLHVLVDPETRLAEAHRIGHRVEQRLRDRWDGLSDVVVHVEPAFASERATVREGGGLKAEG